MAHLLPRPTSREDEAAGYPARQGRAQLPLAPSPSQIAAQQPATSSSSSGPSAPSGTHLGVLASGGTTWRCASNPCRGTEALLHGQTPFSGGALVSKIVSCRSILLLEETKASQRCSDICIGEERWGEISVVQHGNTWAIRGAHFNEDFEDFQFQTVIPLESHETITLASHEAKCEELGQEALEPIVCTARRKADPWRRGSL
eukprot:symbB.v1.2.021419.t1/scaffold1848.1/size98926/8